MPICLRKRLNLDTPEKKEQELTSLHHTKDFFRKIVILGGNRKESTDETGITYFPSVISMMKSTEVSASEGRETEKPDLRVL